MLNFISLFLSTSQKRTCHRRIICDTVLFLECAILESVGSLNSTLSVGAGFQGLLGDPKGEYAVMTIP